MDIKEIIDKFYPCDNELKNILRKFQKNRNFFSKICHYTNEGRNHLLPPLENTTQKEEQT